MVGCCERGTEPSGSIKCGAACFLGCRNGLLLIFRRVSMFKVYSRLGMLPFTFFVIRHPSLHNVLFCFVLCSVGHTCEVTKATQVAVLGQ